MADFIVDDQYTLILVKPVTPAAQEWANEHIQTPDVCWAGSIPVEPRYATELIMGIEHAGFEIEYT